MGRGFVFLFLIKVEWKSKWHLHITLSRTDLCLFILFMCVLVSDGIELIFLPVAAVFWIWYEKNVDNTDVFSYCYEIKDFLLFLIFS